MCKRLGTAMLEDMRMESELVGLCRIAMNETALTCSQLCCAGDSNLFRGVDTGIEIFQRWTILSDAPNQAMYNLTLTCVVASFLENSVYLQTLQKITLCYVTLSWHRGSQNYKHVFTYMNTSWHMWRSCEISDNSLLCKICLHIAKCLESLPINTDRHP